MTRNKQTKPAGDINKLVEAVVNHPQNATLKTQLERAARKDPVKVLTTIIRYQYTQYQKEISTWKMARQEAKDINNPRRVLLTDLYEDIEVDGFIHGLVHNKRIFKISNKPFKIVDKNGKEQTEKTALFKHQWFNDFLKLAMQSRFHGYRLAYFIEWDAKGLIKKTDMVPPRHVIPEKHIWTIYQYDMEGFDYTQPPFSQYMIGIGREDDLGLYEKAALLYILKKHSWQSWDEFEERFGIPIPIVETATTDAKVLNTIEKWLRDLSTGSYGVIPDGGKLTVVETGKADAHQVFFKKIEMAQMELEVLFTGQIRETNKSGTYGKEKSKEDEAQELIADDKTFISNLINDQLIPNILIPNGYPFADGDRFDWNDGAKATPKERLEIFKGVKELGFKLDLKQVSEELDVIIEEAEEPEGDDPAKPISNEKPNNLIPEAIVQMHTKINELYNVH
jgi:hypothetical protein